MKVYNLSVNFILGPLASALIVYFLLSDISVSDSMRSIVICIALSVFGLFLIIRAFVKKQISYSFGIFFKLFLPFIVIVVFSLSNYIFSLNIKGLYLVIVATFFIIFYFNIFLRRFALTED